MLRPKHPQARGSPRAPSARRDQVPGHGPVPGGLRASAVGIARLRTSISEAHRGCLLLLRREDYDVIFCDLMMPDLTGMELHESIAAHRQALRAREGSRAAVEAVQVGSPVITSRAPRSGGARATSCSSVLGCSGRTLGARWGERLSR
ncbi:response regulator [Archangium gephyra]|nr:response regulator [Archangium gephyra]